MTVSTFTLAVQCFSFRPQPKIVKVSLGKFNVTKPVFGVKIKSFARRKATRDLSNLGNKNKTTVDLNGRKEGGREERGEGRR